MTPSGFPNIIATLSATLTTRLGVADRVSLPARDLAALHLGHLPTDAEIRAVLRQIAALDTKSGPIDVVQACKSNRVWLTISKKK